jgi:hypothetical protein
MEEERALMWVVVNSRASILVEVDSTRGFGFVAC